MLSRRKFLTNATLGAGAFLTAQTLLRSAPETTSGTAATPPASPAKTGVPAVPSVLPGGTFVDWHAHFLPPLFLEHLRKRTTPPQIITNTEGKEVRLNDVGGTGQPIRSNSTSIDERLRANEAAGVSHQVLSLPGLGGDGLPPLDVAQLAQAFNNGISEVVSKNSQHFSGLAALPSTDIDFGAHELERAVNELGLLGALLPVDAFLTLASARELIPILKVADRLSAHLFIHPGTWRRPGAAKKEATPDDVPYRSNVIDLQGRIATAFDTIAFSDLFTPFKNVTVQVANLGGAIPFYVDRFQNVARERGQPDPIPAFRRFYVDSGSQGTRSVELAASVLGADRILFGTDSPGFSLPENLHAVNASRLSDAEKRQLLSENGLPILNRKRV